MEYRDPTTNEFVGLDIDLANELAKRLGVKIVWSETPFAELIPSLQTKRADFIISGISDRSSRRETADFIDYLSDRSAVLRPGGKSGEVSPSTSAARRSERRAAPAFRSRSREWSKQNCEASGKPAVQYVPGENSIDVRNQLKQGRIDAAVQGSETLPYAQAAGGREIPHRGEPLLTGYQGIMFRKDDAALREVVTRHLRGDDHRRLLQGHSRQIRIGCERGDPADDECGDAMRAAPTLAEGFPDIPGCRSHASGIGGDGSPRP